MLANMILLLLAAAIFLSFAQDVEQINSLRAEPGQNVRTIGRIEAWNAIHGR